ncbi:MAG: hypothetical protein OSB41_10835 [Kiritimatiellae bacterium]|nr:hypothetical protein [Kiritimatiellia bacterium]
MRNIHVSSTDAEAKLVLLKWARRMTRKIETRLGLESDPCDRNLRIYLKEISELPGASSRQEISFGVAQQFVSLQQIDDLDRDLADTALCHAIIMSFLNAQWTRDMGTSYRVWVSERVPNFVPSWLCRGLARGLHTTLRAADSETVLEAYAEGRLPTVGAFTDAVLVDIRDSLAQAQLLEAMSTSLVEWLLSYPEPELRTRRLLTHLAKGNVVDAEWFASVIPDCNAATSVDAAWGAWLKGDTLRLRRPGTTRLSDLQKLDELVQVNVDDYDLFQESHKKKLLPLRTVLSADSQQELRRFVIERQHALRILSLGKGDVLNQAVNDYCQFLKLVSKGEDAKDCLDVLSQAAAKHDRIRRTLSIKKR